MLAPAAVKEIEKPPASLFRLWQIAAFLAMTAVIAGAFGAHALEKRVSPENLATFETGARYQMYHALGMFAVCWIMSARPSRWATASGICMLLGVVLFSGSLYLLCFVKWRWLGPVTPLGGSLLIVAWLFLIIAARRKPLLRSTVDDRAGEGG